MSALLRLFILFLAVGIAGCRKTDHQIPVAKAEQELVLPSIVADFSKKTAKFESVLSTSIGAKKTTRVTVKVSFSGDSPKGDSVPVVLNFYRNQAVFQSVGALLDLKSGTFDEVFDSPEPGKYELKFVLVTPADRLEATTPIVIK